MHRFDKFRSASGFAMMGACIGGMIGGNAVSAIGGCLGLVALLLGDWE
jgi:hypothetical protein